MSDFLMNLVLRAAGPRVAGAQSGIGAARIQPRSAPPAAHTQMLYEPPALSAGVDQSEASAQDTSSTSPIESWAGIGRAALQGWNPHAPGNLSGQAQHSAPQLRPRRSAYESDALDRTHLTEDPADPISAASPSAGVPLRAPLPAAPSAITRDIGARTVQEPQPRVNLQFESSTVAETRAPAAGSEPFSLSFQPRAPRRRDNFAVGDSEPGKTARPRIDTALDSRPAAIAPRGNALDMLATSASNRDAPLSPLGEVRTQRSLPAEQPSEAAANRIEVHIGRIEVHAAQPPSSYAQPSSAQGQPRAAAPSQGGQRTEKGFAGYERMRNYLG